MTHDAIPRARALLGTRFRAQGRDAAYGLDCLGLVLVAFGLARKAEVPAYRLRGATAADILAGATRYFRKVSNAALASGDVLVLDAGDGQVHLAIQTDGGFIHADARIGKVVETPGAPAWPIVAILRRRARNRKAG